MDRVWYVYSNLVPKKVNSPLPCIFSCDCIERDIDVVIPKIAYDPRVLLEGIEENGSWKAGFFDKGSFKETLAGWAKGVIVGRARLGGIPMGVIVTESRATENIEFADPSVETSHESVTVQAGQVWFPNSAHKTAQAIRDFNYGEQLPLIIFANWRGFAGGQKDMANEVLKFGAQIVDALVDFKQPVFIYVIGELRGGAWVVVDPTINPTKMEMYVEEEGRGGVIEPEGIVEIKFRTPKLIAAMQRLDPIYGQLRQKPQDAESKKALQKREKELMPIFVQAAVQFADLHDRPGRLLAKGVVKKVIPWSKSRAFFGKRLAERMCEVQESTRTAALEAFLLTLDDAAKQRVMSVLYE